MAVARLPRPLARPCPGSWLTLVLLLAMWLPSGPALAEEQLRVVSILPSGRVDRLSQVAVRFSRPMRPLGEMAQESATSPLRLTPQPQGSFRWLDPQTLAFILDTPLSGATRIKVNVAAGAKAGDGTVLAETAQATIETPPVEVLEVSPSPGSALGPRPEIRLTMNQAVEAGSLTARAYLLISNRRLPLEAVEAPPDPWAPPERNLARTYILTPAQELTQGQRVRLRVEPGVLPAQGDLPSTSPHEAVYRSFDALSLVKWNMGSPIAGKFNPASDLTLEFNNPVSPKELAKALSLTPAPPIAPSSREDEEPTRYIGFSLGLRPRSEYRLTVVAGVRDAYGTALAKPMTLALATGDHSPVFSLLGEKGVVEAVGRPLYPLRLRNVAQVKAAVRHIAPEAAVKAFLGEAERPYDKHPARPKAGEGGAVLHELSYDLTPNQIEDRPLDLAEFLGRSPQGGLVLLDLRAELPDPQGKIKREVRRALVQVTDLGLALKAGLGGGAVWTTRLSSGAPLAGVTLELRDRANKVLWRGVSGQDGLARLPSLEELKPARDRARSWKGPELFLLARQGEDFAFLPSDWSGDLVYSLPPTVDFQGLEHRTPLLAHAITQLPLYQPGQTVRYALYLRGQGAQGLTPPPAGEAVVTVDDPAGRTVHTVKATPNAFGSLSGEFELTSGARLGEYSFAVKLAERASQAGGFRVASFRPPDFTVNLRAPAEVVGAAADTRLELESRYLFGAPVPQSKAKISLSQRPEEFAPARLEGWAVGEPPPPGEDEPRRLKALGSLEASLDDQGRGGVTLPAPGPQPGQPVRLLMEAAVADASGLTVTGRGSILAHPAGVYLGVKAPTLAEAGKPAPVSLLAATHDDQPAGPLKVKLTVFREVWETVRERGPGGFYRHLGQARRDKVWESSLQMPTEGGQANFTPPEAGAYVVVAETTDAQARVARSSTYLYAAGAGLAGWQRFDDNSLELAVEKSSLTPGQSARLLLKNPFAKALALVSVERLGVQRLRVVEVEGPAPVIEVPVTAEDAPNMYVSVLLVRGRAGPPPETGPDLARPQVRLGCAAITVKDPQAGLKVNLTPSVAEARPGQEIEADVVVSGQDGAPKACEVTLLAVDARVLAAAGEVDSYDLAKTFLKPRPLHVTTADLRTQVVGQRFAGQKGEDATGGGGLGPAMRSEFHPAVFWLAQASTDAEGRLHTRFRLPDSLTAYRLVAVAATPTQDFGLARTTVRARRPLQMLSALPRFATQGDRFSARVLVQNLSDAPGKVTVSAEATGLKLEGPATQEIELKPGQSAPVGFMVSALTEGQAALTVRARLGSEEDAARFTLPVLPATQLVTSAAAGDLDPSAGRTRATVPLLLPTGSQPGRGGVEVTLAPSLASSLQAPAHVLAEYPWDCLEQRLSRAAALALRLGPGALLGLPPGPDDRAGVRRALASAVDFQTGEGGFAFWPGRGRADLYLTAYALLAASRMEQAGVALPDEVKKKALDFLEQRLRRSPAPQPGDLAGRSAEAMALWALAAGGRDVRQLMEGALKRAQGLDPFGLSALMLAAEALKMPGAVELCLERLESSAAVTAQHMHFATVEPGALKAVLGSTLRGNALALMALAKARPDYPRLDALAAWVALRLGQSQILSTQESIFGLWGVSAFLELGKAEGQVEMSVRLAGRELAAKAFATPAEPPLKVDAPLAGLIAGQAQELLVEARGGGRPMWAARLAYAPGEASGQPVNAGLSLSRLLLPKDKAGGQGSRPLEVGDLVQCLLTLAVSDTRHHVLVHDPYPAGLEPAQAVRGVSQEADDEDDRPSWDPWRWQELRQSGLLLYAPRLEPGVYSHRYTLRVVAPGRFVHAPARAEEMYSPEVFGTSPAGVVEVR